MLFFKPQTHWLEKGKPQFIGRVENINTDFDILMNFLGIKSRLKLTNTSPEGVDLGNFSKQDFRRVAEYYNDDFIAAGYPKNIHFFN